MIGFLRRLLDQFRVSSRAKRRQPGLLHRLRRGRP